MGYPIDLLIYKKVHDNSCTRDAEGLTLYVPLRAIVHVTRLTVHDA